MCVCVCVFDVALHQRRRLALPAPAAYEMFCVCFCAPPPPCCHDAFVSWVSQLLTVFRAETLLGGEDKDIYNRETGKQMVEQQG